jgi:prepilin-type N-terminal cleavage/methylation domain-containing protein
MRTTDGLGLAPTDGAIQSSWGQDRSANRDSGFSAIELLVVIIVIAALVAIAVPSLLSSRKAANEGIARPRLSAIAAAEATYRSTLGRNRYATFAQLRSTVVGGVSLISPQEVDTSGNPLPIGGWTVTQLEAPTDTTFGVGIKAPGSTNSYCVFEDAVVRVACAGCQCTRSSAPAYSN